MGANDSEDARQRWALARILRSIPLGRDLLGSGEKNFGPELIGDRCDSCTYEKDRVKYEDACKACVKYQMEIRIREAVASALAAQSLD